MRKAAKAGKFSAKTRKRRVVKTASVSRSARKVHAPLFEFNRVLNSVVNDPSKQLPLSDVIEKILVLAQVLSEKILYPYQVKLASRIAESILLHDSEIITSLMSRQAGKSLEPGTEILMFDGSVKKVEHVEVGDLIMGDDSTPRKVLALGHGRERMYEVKPRAGYAESYTVNEPHILSVKKRFKHGKPTETVDMPVKEYLSQPKSVKENMIMGYKVPVDYKHKPTFIDPYFLGLWLGDGNSDNQLITTPEPEVDDFLTAYATKLDMKVSYYQEVGDCQTIALVKNDGTKKNRLLDYLRHYKLINDKHIPFDYMVNSREERLQLLAGLIDSDGSKGRGAQYEITQKREGLARDIQRLARSLGYRASLKRRKVKCQTGYEGYAWRVSLYGELWEVPVKVDRKKIEKQELRENPRTYGFDLVDKGIGDYYGFAIDGNKRFVLGDFTVTHNTETLGSVMAALSIALPMLAKQYPECWYFNITDDNGVDRGFRKGFRVGIYAPKQHQSEITFDRVKKCFETDSAKKILEESNIGFDTSNGNCVILSNGSRIMCDSASENSKIEGETHHTVVAEEVQDIGDMKLKKSIFPMVASTMGSIVMIGTASSERCTFYDQIKINERMALYGGVKNHFFFPYTVCAKENSLYAKTVNKQMIQLGVDSDEFKMSYLGEFIFERGMFVTQGQLYDDRCAAYYGPASEFVENERDIPPTFRYYSLVAGIDWGAANDSTFLALLAVDWRNPLEEDEVYDSQGEHRITLFRKHMIGLWNFAGDNYEEQYHSIQEILKRFSRLRKIVMDSNACGRPLYDRFCVNYSDRDVEIEPFNFTPKLKSDGYKTFHGDIVTGRFTFPCSKKAQDRVEFRQFTSQMLDLRKTYKNGNLCVSHPEEKGAHDDSCIMCGFLTLTKRGNIPIETVVAGDEVMTRKGWRKVLWSGQTGVRKVIRVGNLVATPDHPFWSEDKKAFIPLEEMTEDTTILSCVSFTESSKSLLKKIANILSLKVTDIAGIRTPKKEQPCTIISLEAFSQKLTTSSQQRSCSTELFGSTTTGLFQKEWLSIIKTKIQLTIQSRIWSFLHLPNTQLCTCGVQSGKLFTEERSNLHKLLHESLLTGSLKKQRNVLENKQRIIGKNKSIVTAFAKSVVRLFKPVTSMTPALAPLTVRHVAGDEDALKRFEESEDKIFPVYNLTVEGEHEFVCQGVLVHNCDAAMVANYGASSEAISNTLAFSNTNPFL